MAYGTVNADTLVTSTSGGILGAGNASIMKNRIINGAMVIDQRNAGASVSLITGGGNGYPTDRWYSENSTSGTATVQQVTDAPSGFSFSAKWTVTGVASSLISTDSAFFQQKIEGFNTADLMYGTATALTTTVSFWVKSSVTGTFGGAFANSAYNRAYSFTYTINSANTWEQKSITVVGDTSGTWVGATNGIGLKVAFALAAGSARGSTAGSWGAFVGIGATGGTNLMATNGATFYITGVQLEVGSSATGFEYVNYQTSLANCQRYYEKSFNQSTAPANNLGSNTGECLAAVNTTVGNGYTGAFAFRVSKRTSPTITLYNRSNASNDWAWYIAAGTITNGGQIATSGENYFSMQLNGGTTSTIAAGHFTASAEL